MSKSAGKKKQQFKRDGLVTLSVHQIGFHSLLYMQEEFGLVVFYGMPTLVDYLMPNFVYPRLKHLVCLATLKS